MKSKTSFTLELVLSDGRLKQAQQKMVAMLKVIDKICTQHGLAYWLDAGTLLGAVRHQGFIPWDDDMDIGMPRDSYEKFLKIAPQELPEHIWLQTAQTDKNYYNLGAPLKIRDKNSYYLERHERGDEPYVQGIFIDVFVYDNLPRSTGRQKRYKWLAKKLLRILATKYCSVPMGHYAPFYRALGRCFSKRFLESVQQRLILKAKRENSPYLGRGYHCKKTNVVHINDIYPLKRLSFESGEFYVFHRYHEFLTNQYGDYMTFPPEEMRSLRHCRALVPEL